MCVPVGSCINIFECIFIYYYHTNIHTNTLAQNNSSFTLSNLKRAIERRFAANCRHVSNQPSRERVHVCIVCTWHRQWGVLIHWSYTPKLTSRVSHSIHRLATHTRNTDHNSINPPRIEKFICNDEKKMIWTSCVSQNYSSALAI